MTLGTAGSNGVLAPGVAPREVWAWAMYDVANSSYTTVVVTAIFNAYFVTVIAANAVWATFAWTAALGVSSLLIMLTAPPIGAYADARAAKKGLLGIATAGCVLTTAALALAGPGDVALALCLVVLSNFFFGTGENLVAAFLPELASERGLGRVSGWGWGLGYLGGLASLGICLAFVVWAQARPDLAASAVPGSMLITAVVFALAALPTFVFLRERAVPQVEPAEGIVLGAFARLAKTVREARRYIDLRRFLVCIVFYHAGIQAVVALAAIYAQQAMGFTMTDTIVLIFVVNITAAIGAFAFGYVQDRLGHKITIALTLIGWVLMTLLAWAAEGPALFWLAANVAGICLGSSQSAGRALIGALTPPNRLAEFYGLWGMAVKFSGILGPLTYGSATWLSGGEHRIAMLLLSGYFVLGLVALAGVDIARGRRAASASDAR